MNDISIYDEVSFPSHPHPLSHPQRLATIGRLRGLVTPLIDQCRVLELGCGAGGNLIPMAQTLPGSEFLGIDLSQQQIEIARQHVRAVGLDNIQFLAADFLTLDESLGAFDYILCHGVYSWTTDEGRGKILELCRDRLSPSGMAYINYNTFPGWHVQGMLRDMLRFHSAHVDDPARRVIEARKMIDFLLAELTDAITAPAKALRDELIQLQGHSDPYLFHAYLNVVNQPFYLHQMIERAAKHGLAYIGDSEPQAMWPAANSPQTVERIRQLTSRDAAEQPALTADPLAEQYYDFVRVSLSRRSLFCHDNVEIRAVSVKQALEDLHLSYLPSDRRQLTITDERLASVLRLLSEAWPESRPWATIRAEVERTAPLRNRWFDDLFRLFVLDIVQWSVQPNIAMRSISTRPRTTACARQQAASSVVVTNLRHQPLMLKTADRLVLHLLDGMHTREDIATACSMPLESVEQSLLRLASASLIVA